MTLEELVAPRSAVFGSLFYLRFIGRLGLAQSTKVLADARRMKHGQERRFRPGVGRLARGGLLPRLGDALFSATLLLRGRVPGATAAAAELKYAALPEDGEPYVYQGCVVSVREVGRSASTGSSTPTTTGARASTGSSTTSLTGR